MKSSASSDRGLGPEDLPALYEAADAASATAQREFLRLSRIRLIGLVVAAAAGTVVIRSGSHGPDWAGVVALLAFLASFVSELQLHRLGPERKWYELRAAAESAKTLAWRYAVGGDPFPVGDDGADERLLERLKSVLDVLKNTGLSSTSSRPHVTEEMRSLRSSALPQRVSAYRSQRVGDQQAWYATKASWNRGKADWWTRASLVVEFAGIVAAVLKAVAAIEGDWLGVAGAMAAAIAGWVQAKKYDNLASAYSVTSLELSFVMDRASAPMSESEWTSFVGNAEEAFSREHTLWKASRGIDPR